MSDPIIRVDSASFSVGSATLVDSVSLEVAAGSVVAICGPNGAGKSTLLRMLAGDLVADEGEVLIDGAPVGSTAPSDLSRMRSVFQQSSRPDAPFTVRAVVAMGRYPYRGDAGVSGQDDARAIHDAMERTDVAQFAGRSFATLSGGERTRVLMAQVIAQAAPVALLDEPTTALDVAHQEAVLEQISDLASAGTTVIAVLHDLNAAAFYADVVVLMAEGRVVATGTPAEVLNEDLLVDIYRQPITVIEHPTRQCPLVVVA
ncbi:MAG: heme ABC transporter ATP-binding protein [Acidimicrobiia bacterium]|nr:heme ABC transporter ATP-binding protein [Acidimicrobiia bacterium]